MIRFQIVSVIGMYRQASPKGEALMTGISCDAGPRLRRISALCHHRVASFAFSLDLNAYIWKHPLVKRFIAIFVFAVAVLSSLNAAECVESYANLKGAGGYPVRHDNSQ